MNAPVIQIQHRESEQFVLGSCMMDPAALAVTLEVLGSEVDVFVTGDHQLIFDAICSLKNQGASVDPIAVAEYLDRKDNLNRAGGGDYLYGLYARITETESTEYYANIVLDRYRRRMIASHQAKINEMAHDLNIDIEEIREYSDRIMKKVDAISNLKGVRTLGAGDIFDMDIEPKPAIIEGLMRQGLILFAGEPKVGKSYALLNLALAAAYGQGAKVWSHYDMKDQFKTLYLAYESDYDELKERFTELNGGERPPDNLRFEVIEGDDFEDDLRLDTQGLNRIARTIADEDIKLVIVDTWERAKPLDKVEGNAYEKDYKLLAPISKMVKRLNISMILVHHTTKARDELNPFNEVSGSRGLQAVPDTIMVMKHVGEDGQCKLHVQQRRGRTDVIGLEVNTNRPGVVSVFDIDDISEDDDDGKTNTAADAIYEIFQEAGKNELTTAMLVDKSGKSASRTKSALKELLDKGYIEKARHGYYRLSEVDDTYNFND